jgi:hypothetical protein
LNHYSCLGQIVFDATGKVAIHKLEEISKALVNSLLALGEEQNVSIFLLISFSYSQNWIH